ncbi:MAG TPA: dipeptidase, partial [Elusimicrobia bacterium]|nr:dipeptidase [Elusimicrobiota bacterium]
MLRKALAYRETHQQRFVQDLSGLVRIPSCSFPGFPPAELQRSAEAVAELCGRAGLEHVKLLRFPDAPPYVYGDWLHAPRRPTVLLYAHHDVQPPGREELWKSPAFSPAVRGGRLYGRGACDDKAGICLHTAAVESFLQGAGKLPLNVKVLIEGEEEVSSRHLPALLEKNARLLQSDTIAIADTGNFETGLPSITTSLRGLVAFDVTVRVTERSLHSGMWGGPLPDPVQALSKMLASLTDAYGRIAVPGIYRDVRPLSAVERKSFASLRYGESAFRRQASALPGVQTVGGKSSPAVKLWREPTLAVNAIQASSRKDCANVINESAWCHLGLRTVPDMHAGKTAKLLMGHLKRMAPWGVKVEFS